MGGCCAKGPDEKKILQELQAKKKPIFWVFGGPGSGKGTQCARLAEKYGLVHISSGDLLREEVAAQSELGSQINEIMMTGQLVPRDVVLTLLKKKIVGTYKTAKGYLIDGYPREVVQGKEFEEEIAPCTQIIYFECTDDTMRTRLLERAKVSQRADDNEETIVNRIKLFHDVSEPVIEVWAPVTTKISGEAEPDVVFEECCQKLQPLMSGGQQYGV